MIADSPENYLIIGPSWIGDMVMAQSLFIALKRQQPECHITVVAPAWTRPLLDRMPEVDDNIGLELDHGDIEFGARRRIGRSLRSSEYSSAIILPNSFKSALIPWHAGIPRRIGWRGEWRNLLLTDCRKLTPSRFPLMVQRYVALAYPPSPDPPRDLPRPRLSSNPQQVLATLAEFELSARADVLAICPGAEFGETKQWPARHYAELCQDVLQLGWQVWIFGSPNDRLVAESIMADIDGEYLDSCINLTGRTSLNQVIDLMAVTKAVVSNDSGLMHIAAALAKPVVGIYGSTSPDFTPPLAERVKLLTTDIECRPCFQRRCPYGHMRCLTELKPDQAVAAVTELIASG